MRFKYYQRLFGQMSKKKPFVLFCISVVFVIVVLIISLFKNIMPMLLTLCESRAAAIALKITNETVSNELNAVTYESLINLKYNNEGKLIAVSANAIEMNKLSSTISYSIQDKLLNITDLEVEIPIGKLLGWSIFSGYGPKIKIKLLPTGNVISKFGTKFVSEGINQTKHTINIDVTANVRIVAPFISNVASFTNSVTVAETIIIGDIPATYYNIEGIEDLSKKDSLNMLEK